MSSSTTLGLLATGLLALVVPRPATAATPRNVYLDMGANWANTLRLYRDFATERSGPWEVYAFEASPFIQPYLEDFVHFLNDQGPRPPLEVPPSGSIDELALYAKRYGCGGLSNRDKMIKMRQCMWKTFRAPLSRMKPDPRFLSMPLALRRMAEAQRPLQDGEHDRFTFVPAAVGAGDGKMRMTRVTPEAMIRGGAHSSKGASPPTKRSNEVDVPMVDVATWIMARFSDADFVFLKMDVEGAEFGVINKLIDLGAAGRIKRFFWECHRGAGNCRRLRLRWRNSSYVLPVTEGTHGYHGFDSLSAPDKYFPEDPRKV